MVSPAGLELESCRGLWAPGHHVTSLCSSMGFFFLHTALGPHRGSCQFTQWWYDEVETQWRSQRQWLRWWRCGTWLGRVAWAGMVAHECHASVLVSCLTPVCL
jgi:hypothetical protein